MGKQNMNNYEQKLILPSVKGHQWESPVADMAKVRQANVLVPFGHFFLISTLRGSILNSKC